MRVAVIICAIMCGAQGCSGAGLHEPVTDPAPEVVSPPVALTDGAAEGSGDEEPVEVVAPNGSATAANEAKADVFCAGEETEVCIHRAFRLHRHGERSNREDQQLAIAVLDELCARRVPSACHTLGRIRTAERGLPLALEAYLAGCEAEDLYQCAYAGSLLSRPGLEGITPDPERALDLLQHACSLGECFGCLKLAEIYAEGRTSIPADATLERVYTERVESIPECLP